MIMVVKIGFYEDNITGPVGIPQTGYMERTRVSEGVNDPLFCSCMFFEVNSRKYAIVSLDLCAVDKKFSEKIRDLSHKMVGIPKENIIIAATHTHSAMDGFLLGWAFKIDKFPRIKFYKTKGLPEEDYVNVMRDFIAYKVSGCVYASSLIAKSGHIGVSSINLHDICSNRHDPSAFFDPELFVLGVANNENKLLGSIINYSCHPTVLSYDNYLYSADFIGYVREFLKRNIEGHVPVYLNGACGEISTRFTRRAQNFQEAKRLGYMLGSQILFLLNKMELIEEIKNVESKIKEIKLPLKQLPSYEEAKKIFDNAKEEYEKLKSLGAPQGKLRVAWTKVEGALEILERIKLGLIDNEVNTFIQALKINENVFIGVPGELYSTIAYELKQYGLSLGKKVIVIGYANDYIGYLLPPEEFQKQTYESFMSFFDDKTSKSLINDLKLLIREI
jgi:hypothetical protein